MSVPKTISSDNFVQQTKAKVSTWTVGAKSHLRTTNDHKLPQSQCRSQTSKWGNAGRVQKSHRLNYKRSSRNRGAKSSERVWPTWQLRTS